VKLVVNVFILEKFNGFIRINLLIILLVQYLVAIEVVDKVVVEVELGNRDNDFVGLQPGLHIVIPKTDLAIRGLALDQTEGERLLFSRTVSKCQAVLSAKVCTEERVADLRNF